MPNNAFCGDCEAVQYNVSARFYAIAANHYCVIRATTVLYSLQIPFAHITMGKGWHTSSKLIVSPYSVTHEYRIYAFEVASFTVLSGRV